MNQKMMRRGVFVLSLLALLQLTQAQNATDTHSQMDMKQSTQKNEIVIDPVRLQAIGITSEPVRRQLIEKQSGRWVVLKPMSGVLPTFMCASMVG